MISRFGARKKIIIKYNMSNRSKDVECRCNANPFACIYHE